MWPRYRADMQLWTGQICGCIMSAHDQPRTVVPRPAKVQALMHDPGSFRDHRASARLLPPS